MDPLSELLLSLTPKAHVISINRLRGEWGFVTPWYPPNVLFSAHVIRGRIWARRDEGNWFCLEQGESVLVSGGGRIEYASDPARTISPAEVLLEGRENSLAELEQVGVPLVLEHGTGDPVCHMLSMAVIFRRHESNPILYTFSPFYKMDRGDDRLEGLISGAVQFLAAETHHQRPGYRAAAAHLTNLLITEQLRRLALDLSKRDSPNVFRGLADARVGHALNAIYKMPGEFWTTAALARESGMSRSTFARRFENLIGTPVHAYLTQWRMGRAAQMLREQPLPKSEQLASELGYASERAFRAAFRRVHGCSPKAYARSRFDRAS